MAYTPIENITCALQNQKVGTQTQSYSKATKIIVFELIGRDVFERKNYKSHKKGTEYRSLTLGNGELVRPVNLENGLIKLGYNLILSTDDLVLKENATTGGYPGAGPAPVRINKYKCLEDYVSPLMISKAQIKADFNL